MVFSRGERLKAAPGLVDIARKRPEGVREVRQTDETVEAEVPPPTIARLQAELAAAAPGDNATRSCLHELLAGAHAARGEWQQAYLQLRGYLDLLPRLADPGRSGAEHPAVGRRERRLASEVALLRRESEQAHEASMRDALTDTFNRRFLDKALAELTARRGSRAQCDTCVALVDLDLFKQVNDTYGHPMGDRVLQQVVELLQVDLTPDAFCARYGGEEFVLVLPGSELPAAVALCERARSRIETHDWQQLADGMRVTVSIGVAPPGTPASPGTPGPPGTPAPTPLQPDLPTDAHQQLLRADSLLYAAKASGRNAVAFRSGPGGRVQLAGPASRRRLVRDPSLDCAWADQLPDR